jgi:hypothetical protein
MSTGGMMGLTTTRLTLLLACAALAPQAFAHTDEDCTTFTWDVSRELAAMRSPAIPVNAMPTTNGPALELGKHYAAALLPQPSVSFVVPPARQRKADHPMAGLLSFKTEKTGRYRVSLTTSHWIDLLNGASVIDSKGHEGRGACELLHKVVEFELPANTTITLQLSGGDAAMVGIIVTSV